MVIKFSKLKSIGLISALVLLFVGGCQAAAQSTPTPIPTAQLTSIPIPTQTMLPTLTPSPTVSRTATYVTPTLSPGTLSPEQPWLAYASRPGTVLSLVNQDGSGYRFLFAPSSFEHGPPCFTRTYIAGDLPSDGSSWNRMIKMNGQIYIIQPPETMYVYRDDSENCPELGFRWKAQDDLLAISGVGTVPTLFIYELPSMKVRERFPLIKSPEIDCRMKQPPNVCDMNRQIAWSPDGRYLAFSAVGESTATDLYVYDSTTRTTRQLTNNPAWIKSFWWSPDANLILFTEAEMVEYYSYACVTSVSVVSRESGQIREMYKPSELLDTPDRLSLACWQGLYEWVSNTKFLISDGGVRTMHDTGASNMRLIDANTGEIKLVFDDRIDRITMDEQKKVMAIYTSGWEKYTMGNYLVPIARPTPQLITTDEGSIKWDETLQLFVAYDDRSTCKDPPKTITSFDVSGNIRCMPPPTPQRRNTPIADQQNLSPDKQWRVSLNEASVTLEKISDKSSSVVLNAPGAQVIWCPSSTCFFLFARQVLYRVSVPDLAIQSIDEQFHENVKKITDYQWLDATDK